MEPENTNSSSFTPQLRQKSLLPPPRLRQAGNTLSTLLFYFSILFFIIGFNINDYRMAGNWTQQFMPNLNNQPLSDLFFIDSLNGWAVTRINTVNDSGYILKTTNSGNNWAIKFKNRNNFKRIIFLNQNTGYTCGIDQGAGVGFIYKSINGGENWQPISVPNGIGVNDISILSEDTLWFVSEMGLLGGVFRTLDGGSNWQFLQGFSSNPNKIYMYNWNLGFICDNFTLRRTTNGGQNWTPVTGEGGFMDMFFADSITGWKVRNEPTPSDSNIAKTTNGGLNWTRQRLPQAQSMVTYMDRISRCINDTIRGTGGYITNYINYYRGTIFTTTNGGVNWLYQIPDTSYGIQFYHNITFINNKTGWAYSSLPTGIHTTNGGDTVLYFGIQKSSNIIPKEFELKQNYPNPFNPRTVIPYKLKKDGYVKLTAYDILGKETQLMVNQNQKAGEYEVDFIGKFATSSGVYFYRLEVTDERTKQLFSETRKMLLVK